MAIILALAVGLILFSSLMMAVAPIESVYTAHRTEILANDMAVIMAAVDRRYQDNPALGYTKPSDLVLVSGYEYLKSYNLERFQFNSASNINDGYWRFNRATLWFESPNDSVGSAYLDADHNTCGASSFSASPSWCGRRQSIWGKIEEKNNFGTQMLAEKQRLYRTIRKFYQRYSADGLFTPMANGQSATLASLVGLPNTPSACVSNYVYNKIPLDCSDLFNLWGVPVVLNKITDNHIALVNRTLVKDSSGQFVRLAEEAILE